MAVGSVHTALVLRGTHEDRVVGVGLQGAVSDEVLGGQVRHESCALGRGGWTYLDMLLQVLRTLEGLAAELAFVRLERHVNANVRGDVVALDGGGAARVPLASEVQVVGALAANMTLTQMFLVR